MRLAIYAGAALAAAMLSAAAPAYAGYGAVAYDADTGRYGFAWNEGTASRAEEIAVRDCQSKGCKVVIPVGPRECAALASTKDGKVWGGKKSTARDAAKLGALENCQKRTKEQCIVRGNECNR